MTFLWKQHPLPFLTDMLNGMMSFIHTTTNDTDPKKAELFQCLPTIWVSMIAFVLDHHKYASSIYEESLLIWRMHDIASSTTWAMVSVYCGGYDSSLRDLRFLLEDFIQAYYLDQSLASSSVLEKTKAITQLEERGLWGTRLIRACNVDQEIQGEVITVYKDLNKFMHPTDKIAAEPTNLARHQMGFSKNRFEQCWEFHRRVYDCICAIFLSSFSDVLDAYHKGSDFVISPGNSMASILKELKLQHTMSLLENRI